MILDRLEGVAHATAPHNQINVITYADDFVITGASKEVLEKQVNPAVQAFLSERGLQLCAQKTHITHIDDGFDFLGFNVRKYGGKLLIKPAKAAVKSFLENIRTWIKANPTAKTDNLIWQLNRKLRGWANYYRHVVSKKTFSYIDHQVFRALTAWIKRRHPNKSEHWKKHRYYRCESMRQWIFFAKIRDAQGRLNFLDVFKTDSVPITRHIKVQAQAGPYHPDCMDYFARRAVSPRVDTHHVWEGMTAWD